MRHIDQSVHNGLKASCVLVEQSHLYTIRNLGKESKQKAKIIREVYLSLQYADRDAGYVDRRGYVDRMGKVKKLNLETIRHCRNGCLPITP